jgi:hypothetical protein
MNQSSPTLSLFLFDKDFFLISIFQYFFEGFSLSDEFLTPFELLTQEPTFKKSNLNFVI